MLTPLLAHRVISLPRSNSVAFGAKRTLSRLPTRIFEYTSYKILMMKLQMRVGGMFWCAPPLPTELDVAENVCV